MTREKDTRDIPIGFLALAICLFLGACSSPPAGLKEKRGYRLDSEAPLGDLLERALEDPNSKEGGHLLGDFVARWFKDREGAASGEIVEGEHRFQVRFVNDRAGCYLPSYFDRIEPAEHFAVRKLEHHKREGIGAPLLALRENTGREPIERFYPPEAIARPVTAIASEELGGDRLTRVVSIRLLCPLRHESMDGEQGKLTVAADFSTPWAALLSRASKLERAGRVDPLRNNPKRQPQLFLMEPYDPDKEPLIMIHGLLDTPLIWAELSNELWAYDDIRNRYQIWHFLYNTSAPALYSGRLLRYQLRELRPLLDPQGDDPAMRSTTLLTHSMGGIIGRSLVTRPGDAFWNAAFTRPLESLKLSEEDRESLREAFFWEPEAHVKRVIFVAVPHRGSDIADNFLGKIGRLFVAPPNTFREFYERISEANPGAWTEAYAKLGSGRLDSVHALSPEQPTLKILAELPLSHKVRVHSVIGDRGKRGPVEESHDGLVPYWSSHLSFADSEKVVPAGHEVFEHPEGMAEIVRLLRLPPVRP